MAAVSADVGGAGTVFALPAIENLLDRPAAFVPTIYGPALQSFRVEGLRQGVEVDRVELGPLQQADVLVRYTPGSLDQVCLDGEAEQLSGVDVPL